MNTRDTLKVNRLGHLEIGGCDTLELVRKFGTPLYVFDKTRFLSLANSMINYVKSCYGNAEIAYASKAFAVGAVYELCESIGLSVDVVSGGELYLALIGGINPERIYFHGNAKTDAEIDFAVKSNVGYIVLEGFDEADKISAVTKKYNRVQDVLIRVNPGVEAHTHSFVQTAKTDSKFGVQLDDEALISLIEKIVDDKYLNFSGLHTHIGSQIFDVTPYLLTVDKLMAFIKKLSKKGIFVDKLNLGGGFGVKYTEADPDFDVADYNNMLFDITNKVRYLAEGYNIKKPTLVFEPGRSLVADAGITLYTVCAIKDIVGIRKYVSVDGGMGDNPRYALYGSRYEATLLERADVAKSEVVTISGKCCESGDIVTEGAKLQPTKVGDTLAVFTTGAYNYSMASNYNSNPVPPVVMVENGFADYIVKPQTYADLAKRNVLFGDKKIK